MSILQEGSIIHPGAQNKTAGRKWPIFPAHQMLLRKLLPSLIETHHAISYYDHPYHNTHNDLGISIANDLRIIVSQHETSNVFNICLSMKPNNIIWTLKLT